MRVFLFLALTCFTFASEPSPTDLATLQGDSSAYVCGYVNAITGQLLIDQDDLVVRGAAPITLHRRQTKNRDLNFFPHTEVQVAIVGSMMTVWVPEKSGLYFPYVSGDLQVDFEMRERHQSGKPHVDVRRRGQKGTKVYFLKENG